MTPVHHVDSMGLHLLEDLVFESKRKGMQLLLANPSKSVSPALAGGKWLQLRQVQHRQPSAGPCTLLTT